MIDSSKVNINNVVVHHIGSRAADEAIKFSKRTIQLQDEEMVAAVLKTYFFSSFKTGEYFNFIGADQGAYSLVYKLASEFFDDPSTFYNTSLQLAEYLYEKSMHPKIKAGEFYLVSFNDCVVDGELVDGLGLFKSENKETFLKVYLKDQNFELGTREGINIRKLDKGCLIFNTERELGFKVAMGDNINKGQEAKFWKDDFIAIQPRVDSYYFTLSYMNLCKDFVNDVYNIENEVPRAEQFDFMNRSLDFFDTKRNFKQDDFERDVIQFPDVSEAFADYRNLYEEDRGVLLKDSFDISKSAVKSEKKYFKSVLLTCPHQN